MKPATLSKYRASQPTTNHGPGTHLVSPQKRASKRKLEQTATIFFDLDARRRRAKKELDELLSPSAPTMATPSSNGPTTSSEMEVDPNSEWVDEDLDSDKSGPNASSASVDHSTPVTKPSKSRRLIPDYRSVNLYSKWRVILPTLVEPLLAYTSDSIAKPSRAVTGDLAAACKDKASCCETSETTVLCLYYDHFKTLKIEHCACQNLAKTLVRNGLFPTAPDQIRMAISIELLDFYSALFERSCDAVNAMAAALNTFYNRRGLFLVNNKGERYKEPFRRGMGYAAQWLDGLRVLVEKHTDSLLEQADTYLQTQLSVPPTIPTPLFDPDLSKVPDAPPLPHIPLATDPPPLPSNPSPPSSPPPVSPEECMRELRQLCPACFGGAKHGRPLEDGGDFQIATDGNFHHRHLVSGGKGIKFHEPRHVIPKSFVDCVGDTILQARKSPSKSRNPKVPDSAVDECEKSHDAADGDKKKSASHQGRYDDMGWMSLVCRHDIPLFFANIDTPGEQQKYAIALILWFFSRIPQNATVTVLYDIGCVLDRSVQMYEILPAHIRPRVQFVTTAMHAYGHQWSCQLMYNPRLCRGLGLTDGEGVERTWSRLRKLIILVRTSSQARRIWLTDRQLSAIAYNLRCDLGEWLKRRRRIGVEEQSKKSRAVIAKCGMSLSNLRAQWDLQKIAQSSIRAHAPSRLKKELDTVLSLQGDLDTVEKAINTAKATLATSATPEESKDILKGLLDMHTTFSNKVEALYVSLNIHDSYPDLKGASLEFVRTLLMAHDLKINVRKRAVGSFFEWDRLDQAVGGRNQALGTKLHQQTRKAIAKRTPALLSAIRKFNAYCVKLENMYDPAWNIPLPLPLPTTLADLRDRSDLMEDVWVSTSETVQQPWLDNPDIRAGIRAMIKLDRCIEEQHRLGQEADNMCAWFRRELGAVELAIRTPKCNPFYIQLGQYRDHLLHLKTRWTNPLASSVRFDSHVAEASSVASKLTGHLEPVFKWTYVTNSLEVGADAEGQDNQDQLDENLPHHELLARDEEEGAIIASEIFERDESDDDEDPPQRNPPAQDLLSDEDDIVFIEVSQTKRVERNDSSVMEYCEGTMSFFWTQPNLEEDVNLLRFINQAKTLQIGNNYKRRDHSRSQAFDLGSAELQILSAKDGLLNDVCMNGLPKLLQALFIRDPQHQIPAGRCTIFSTYDLNRI
ncbi:hypothetical protein HYPSUDRAFT_412056 [Hypholoma sublateritium FD-334 SS-4]|uniref:CxC1-like cysteine cluster associated with KDZ transposases domain-containing protein n=1 Tax=Hypholoma sublateritium (strain FD-334 SS-4) TaxID=945553 RepID=A0A0D2NE65_HYPSF|nr:hypothetical protein HYPSUDRAFT_412056 [Hypholoma sublateritium FD-334 SS-4]